MSSALSLIEILILVLVDFRYSSPHFCHWVMKFFLRLTSSWINFRTIIALLGLELRATTVAFDELRWNSRLRTITQGMLKKRRVMRSIRYYYLIQRCSELIVITFHATTCTRCALCLWILPTINWRISNDLVPDWIEWHLDIASSKVILQSLSYVHRIKSC
jgi:hypothetical protein